MKRRAFFHTLIRGGLFAVMAAITGYLVGRNRVTLTDECTEFYQCQICNRLAKCDLPEANRLKDEEKRGYENQTGVY